MKRKYKEFYVLQNIFYHLVSFLAKRTNNYLHFYLDESRKRKPRSISGYFSTDSGINLPIHENYRYSIKDCWNYYESLTALHFLIQKGLTVSAENDFFQTAKGTRTLSKPLADIKAVTSKAVWRNPELFFHETLEPVFQPLPVPSQKEINTRISYHLKTHQVLLTKLNRFNVDIPIKSACKILEIGFISGGYSIFAFERLGYQSFGIDNFYGNIERKNPTPEYIKQEIGSSVKFIRGDITCQSGFSDNEIDIIYSGSVLEHVRDLDAAFKEMHRILKPGGLIIHCYNPFFCPNGGHALGITDSPWGHVQLTMADYMRYLDELRPFEAEISKEFIQSDLNAVSINEMQHHIIEHGFQILFWQQHAAPPKHQADLTPEIMAACIQNHPHIGLTDLITSTVTFAARKN
jgi:ubiquinone/menaquinone biosynthesis C-methylase UbiE